MNKVYLLLRNNVQSGPYSQEELVQLGLRSLDLIWVTGKSACWCSPAEMGLLNPTIANANGEGTKKAKEDTPVFKQMPDKCITSPNDAAAELNVRSSRYIYVSLPHNAGKQPGLRQPSPSPSLEEKAEELRRRALAYSRGNEAVGTGDTQQTNSPTLMEMREKYYSRLNPQKPKEKKPLSTTVLVAFAAALVSFTSGVLIAKYTADTKKVEAKGAITQPSVKPVLTPFAKEPETGRQVAAETGSASLIDEVPVQDLTYKPFVPVKKKSFSKQKRARTKIVVPATKALEKKENTEPKVADNMKVLAKLKEEGDVVIEPVQKKKNLSEKLNTFFKKFKRKKADDKSLNQPEKISPDQAKQEN